jgi:hypothetical protein
MNLPVVLSRLVQVLSPITLPRSWVRADGALAGVVTDRLVRRHF